MDNAALPDGFVLDAPAAAAPISQAAPAPAGLPAGFVLDQPASVGASAPLPPQRPTDFGAGDPNASYDGLTQPPARPSQADLSTMSAKTKDEDWAPVRQGISTGDLFINPWDKQHPIYDTATQKADPAAPTGDIPDLTAEQATADKTARVAAAQQKLDALKAAPLKQFDTYDTGPNAPDIQTQQMFGSTDPKEKQANAIKQAQAELDAIKAAPLPQNNATTDAANRLVKSAGQSALDIAKPFGQVANDLGAPGLQAKLQQAERQLPQTDAIRDRDMTQQVASGVGAATPFVVGGALGAGVKILAAVGALQNFGSQYDAAKDADPYNAARDFAEKVKGLNPNGDPAAISSFNAAVRQHATVAGAAQMAIDHAQDAFDDEVEGLNPQANPDDNVKYNAAVKSYNAAVGTAQSSFNAADAAFKQATAGLNTQGTPNDQAAYQKAKAEYEARVASPSLVPRYLAGTLGLITGAAQSLPFSRLFEAVSPGFTSAWANMGVKAAQGAIEFPAVQSAVTVGNNAIAKGLYDQDRNLSAGVKENAAAAALVGAFLGVGAGAFHTQEGRDKIAAAAENFDWADTLGVSPDASPAEVRAAFVKRAKETHPDAGGTTEDFQAVNAAYQVYKAGQAKAAPAQEQEQPAQPAAPAAQTNPPPPPGFVLDQIEAPGYTNRNPPLPKDPAQTARENATLQQAGYDHETIAGMDDSDRAKALASAVPDQPPQPQTQGEPWVKSSPPSAPSSAPSLSSPSSDSSGAIAAKPAPNSEATPPSAPLTAPPSSNSTSALDTGKNVPETESTQHAQIAKVESGERPVMMFPRGTQPPERPVGVGMWQNDRGEFWYNPDHVTDEQLDQFKALSKQGRENEFLNPGVPSKPEVDAAVAQGQTPAAVVTRDKDGNEVNAAYTTQEMAPATLKAMQDNAGPGEMAKVEDPAATIAKRKATPAKERPPQSLVGFVRMHGGVKDYQGELAAMNMHTRFPGLVNNKGLPLDEMRKIAAGAGYMGTNPDHDVANTTVPDFLEKLNAHPAYSVHDHDRVAAAEYDRKGAQQYEDALYDARRDIAETTGLDANDIDGETLNHAARLHVEHDVPIEDAFERAAIQSMNSEGKATRAALREALPDLPWDETNAKKPVGQFAWDAEEAPAARPTVKGDTGSPTRGEEGQNQSPQGQTGDGHSQPESAGAHAGDSEAGGQGQAPGITTEPGAEGKPQGVIPGAEKIGDGQLAQIKADQPLKPKKPQAEGVGGMFDEGNTAPQLFDAKPDNKKPTPTKTADANENPAGLSESIAAHFLAGKAFPTIIEARKFVKGHPDGKNLTIKQMDEAVEVGVVRAARAIAEKASDDPKAAYDKLVDLYGRQPNLGARTSQSVAEQAYSTPAPLAYLASQLAGINSGSHVFEPTAGNGMLLIEANPKHTIANEISRDRNDALKAQGFIAPEYDASDVRAARHAILANDGKPFDVVIANPPFGAIKDGGNSKVFNVDGWKTTQIDHAISLESLKALKPGGRAVLIIGGIKAEDPAEIAKGYTGKAKREFFYQLQKAYNVVDHFTVSGDLYTRQGAGWPVDVIVIDGQGQSDRKPPSANPPRLFKSWDDLKGKLDERPGIDGAAKDTGPRGQETGGAVEGVSGSEVGHETGGEPVHGGGPVDRPTDGAAPVPVRGEPDRGQSPGVRTERPVDAGEQHPARERGKRDGAGGDAVAEGNGQLRPRQPKRELTAEESEKPQVDYEVASQRGTALDTLIPRNLRDAADDALRHVEAKHGPVDNYVAEALGYKVDDLPKYFSAEQIDALALAIDNVEKGAGFIIGDQCVAGETRIYDPLTGAHTEINRLAAAGKPITVLSATRNGFKPMAASAPFFKGWADLYRVTLDDGASILVTRGHRFLSERGWISLDGGLSVGYALITSASSPSVLSSGNVGSSLPPCAPADGRHSTNKAEGCQDDCSPDHHLGDGGQPLTGEGIDPASFPSQGDARGHIQPWSHEDGLALLAAHNHPHPSSGHRSKNSSSPLESRDPLRILGQGRAWFESVSGPTHQNEQPSHGGASSLPPRSGEVPSGQSTERDHKPSSSSVDHTGLRRVVSIAFERHDAFYDMRVPFALNYVAEGFVNHNTGIGKGRVVAGAISYAHSQGMIPVFVTEKPDLYGDMWRDLHDIGFHTKLGRPIQMFMTNSGTRVPLDEEAIEWVAEKEAAQEAGEPTPPQRGQFSKAQDSAKAGARMQDILAGDYKPDVVFTTYDQMNSVKGQETVRRNFLRKVAPQSFLIMDEAHNAGGTGGDPPADKAVPRSKVFRHAIEQAKAVMYSSATYAKNPKVMDLFSRTDMSKAVEKPSELPGLIARGGVPLQQVVSTALSKAGQYLRRERSFEGVSYDMETAPVDQEVYSEFTDGLGAIFRFDRTFSEERKELAYKLAAELGAGTGRDGAVGEGGASTTEFSSIMHNAINQMILSIKAKAAAERAVQSLKDGERPVIALSSTMEAFINDFVNAAGLNIGDKADLDFGSVLRRYLERTRRVTLKLGNGDKKHVMIPLSDMSAGMRSMYEDAQALLKEMDFSGLPISPIDYIRNEITKAGFSVREITGRGTTIDYSGKHPVISQRPSSETGPTGKAMTKNRFNSGKTDAVILNRSGSTGISLHASSKFKDQRRRRMIILQADPNIDTFMQMLGRVHRTGQVIPPAYSQLVADIPAEARPAAVLMRKIASLNANTTGARKSKFSGEAVDFMNQYGDAVVASVIGEDPEINWKLGNPISYDDKGRPFTKGAAAKVTGRLTLLKPAEQTELLDRITSTYQRLIDQLDATGENKLEAKTVDLQAEPLGATTIKPRRGDSPFEDAVQLEHMAVKSQGRAMAPEEVISDLAAATEANISPNLPFQRAHDLAVAAGSKQTDARIQSVMQAAGAYAKAKLADVKPEDKDKIRDALNKTMQEWRGWNDALRPGSLFNIPIFGAETPAMVLSVQRISKSKNPVALSSWSVRFAVPDSARMLEIPFSRIGDGAEDDEGEKTSTKIEPAGFDVTPTSFAEMLENARKEGKERRHIFTGNMLAAFDAAKGRGQIINFTMKDGSTQPGILTPRGFDQKKFMKERAVKFTTGAQALKFLNAKEDGEITSTDGVITVRKADRRSGYEFDVPSAKGTGGKYYADRTVRAVWDGWEKRGSRMRATVTEARAQSLIDAMMALDAVFETREHQDVAQGIVDADKLKNGFAEKAKEQPKETVLRKGRANGKENAVFTTIDGTVTDAVDGDKSDFVGFSPALIKRLDDPSQSLIGHHNHPESSSLSALDVGQLGHVGLKAVLAHGHDGASHSASLTDAMRSVLNGVVNRRGFLLGAANVAQRKSLSIMQNIAMALGDEKYDWDKIGSDAANRILHQANIINYHSTYPKDVLNVLEKPRFAKLIGDAAEAVRKSLNATLESGNVARPEGMGRQQLLAVRNSIGQEAGGSSGLSQESGGVSGGLDAGSNFGGSGRPPQGGPIDSGFAEGPRDGHYGDAPTKRTSQPGRWADLRRDLQDLHAPTEHLGERLSEIIGRPLRDEENAYLAKRLIPVKEIAQNQDVQRRFEDPLVKLGKEAGLTLGDLGDRRLYDHAAERNAAIDKLHDWSADYRRRKQKARAAQDEADRAKEELAKAQDAANERFLRLDAAKNRAAGAAAREMASLDPAHRAPTDAAIANIDKMKADLAKAEQDRNVAYNHAVKLQDTADQLRRDAMTPQDEADAARERHFKAEDKLQEAIFDHKLAIDDATSLENEAKHIEGLSEIEAQRSKDNPDNERQKKLASNAVRDAIAMRVKARNAKKAAHAKASAKDKAYHTAASAKDAAIKKQAWADEEEKRRDDSFATIAGKGSGITNEDAAAGLDRQRAEGKEAALDKAMKIIDDLNAYHVKTMLDGGLISPEQAKAWGEQYSHYANLSGWDDPDLSPEDGERQSRKMNVRGKEVKQAFGRTTLANNPVVNMFHATYRSIARAEANKAFQTLYRAIEKAADGTDKIDGLVKLDRADSHWETDDKTGMAKMVSDSLFANDKKAIHGKFAGRPRHIIFNDEKMAQDIGRMTPDAVISMGRAVLMYQGVAKFMWTHAAPAFMVRHFLGRYPAEASLNAGEHGFGAMMRAWKSYPAFGVYHRAVVGADGMGPLERAALASKVANGLASKKERYMSYYHEMAEEGGLMGRNFADIDMIASDVSLKLLRLGDVKDAVGAKAKALTAARILHAKEKAIFAWMDHFTANMDSAQRLAAYIEARMRGESKPQATLAARQATVDFALKGRLANQISLGKTFANIAIQTGARMYRSRKGLAYVMTGMAVMGAIAAALNTVLGGTDDDGIPFYDKIPDHVKQSNVVILNPFRRDRKGRPIPVTLPLPYNYAMPYNLGQSLAQEMLQASGLSRQTHAQIMGRFLRSTVEALTPFGSDETAAFFAPTVAEPFMHVLQNKSFTGAPLHADSPWATTADANQGRINTPDHWKVLAETLNAIGGGNKRNSSALDAYPESLRETLGFVTEAQERTGSQMIDMAHAIQNGEAPDAGRVPGSNVFLQPLDMYDRADESAFYDKQRDVVAAHKVGAAADKAGEGDLITEKQRADADLYKSFAALNKKPGKRSDGGPLAAVNREQQQVRESDMTAAQKWYEVRELEQKKADLMHDFLKDKGR